jgi:hypothetical protein
VQPGELRQVAARLGVAGAHQHTTRLGNQRKCVTRLHHVLGFRLRCSRHLDGKRPIRGGDAGRDTGGRLDGNGEGRTVHRAIVGDHRRQIEPPGVCLGNRHADQSAAVLGHEVDFFGRDEIGGENEITLVLAVFLVHQDDHVAGFDVGDDFIGATDAEVRLLVEQAVDLVHLAALHLEPADYKRFPDRSRHPART